MFLAKKSGETGSIGVKGMESSRRKVLVVSENAITNVSRKQMFFLSFTPA